MQTQTPKTYYTPEESEEYLQLEETSESKNIVSLYGLFSSAVVAVFCLI